MERGVSFQLPRGVSFTLPLTAFREADIHALSTQSPAVYS